MAIFSNNSARSSKRTTPRGPGNLFVQATTTPSVQQQSEGGSTFAPEKTGDSISPSHSITTLNPMEGSSAQRKPPTGKVSPSILDQKPESMVAETLRMKGELEFTRLLRVDGRFEGELITDNGSLVVGPKGEVIGDLKNMQEVYVEGVVRGNVFANDVKIKKGGMLLGDIQCVCLTLDPTASIRGIADTATLKERAFLEANPQAPPASAAGRRSPSSTSAVDAAASGAAPVPVTSPLTAPSVIEAIGAESVKKVAGKVVNEEDIIPAPSPSS